TDSGLDIDALNVVADGVNTVARGSDMGVLIITHYQRILHMVEPTRVSIMLDGRIVKQGGAELVEQLEARGYAWTREEGVASAWGRVLVGRGDTVRITEMEHHSNIVPWQLLCKEVGAELAYVPVDDQGYLDLDTFHELLESKRVKLVAVAHVSNVLGTINP